MTVQYLYKYGTINEYSERLFTTPSVWFSPPIQLNDPFECRPYFTFEGNREQIMEAIIRQLRLRNPASGDDQIIAMASSLYLEGRHRDPERTEELRKTLLQRLANNIGLYCLSSKPNDILMWSHYGSGHSGFCLEFEATANTPFFGNAQKVRYSENFPNIDYFNTPIDEQVNLVFLTKFLGWSYEEEWRIIDNDTGPGPKKYPSELLTGVIFGIKMPQENKTKIRDWINRGGRDVSFYQAVLNEKKFAIEIQQTE